MSNLETAGLERQLDPVSTSRDPGPGTHASAPGLPRFAPLTHELAHMGPDERFYEADAERRPPNFERLKEALLLMPPEMVSRLAQLPDSSCNSHFGFWQRGGEYTALLSSHVIALLCGFALALPLGVVVADLDAASPTQPGGAGPTPETTSVSSVRGPDAAVQPDADVRSSAAQPKDTTDNRAPDSAIGHDTPAAISSRTPPSVSINTSSRTALSAHATPYKAHTLAEAAEVQAARNLTDDEGVLAAAFEHSEDVYALAHRLLRSGDRQSAERAFRRSLELASSPAAAYDLGYLLQQQGRYAEAATSYELATQISPPKAYVLYNLATVLSKLERLDEAAVNFKRAAALDPSNPFILYDWGWALERTGALALAEDKYRNALAVGPGTAAATNARARLHALGRHPASGP